MTEKIRKTLMIIELQLSCCWFLFQFYRPLECWTLQRLKPVAVGLFRFLIWGFTYEFLLHYLYSGALIHKPHLLAVLPLWAVAGTGYTFGMFFVVKYIVIWALCAAVGRLDQLDPPDVPSCGSHIYLYSKIWKQVSQQPVNGTLHSVSWQMARLKIPHVH